MHVLTLIVIGLLCIAFKSTRWIGIAGLTLLSLVFPPLFFAFLILGGIGYYLYHYWRKHHEFPRLIFFRR